MFYSRSAFPRFINCILAAGFFYTCSSSAVAAEDNSVFCSRAAKQIGKLQSSNETIETILEHLKNASKLCPYSIDIRFATGVTYYKAKDFGAAKKVFLEIEDTVKKSHVAAAIAQSYLALENINKSRLWFNEALARDPKEYSAIVGLGVLNLKTDNLLESERLFKKALPLSLDDASLHYNLGIVFSKNSRFEEAIDSLRQSLAIDQQLWQAHLRLAEIYLAQKQYSKATEEVNRAMPIAPKESAVYLSASHIEELQGNYQSGLKMLNAGISQCGPLAELELAKAVMLVKAGKTSDGIGLFETLHTKEPSSAQYSSHLAWALLQDKRYSRAEKLLLEVIARDENNVFALNNLGVLFERTGRLKESMKMFKRSAIADPTSEISKLNLRRVRKSSSNE